MWNKKEKSIIVGEKGFLVYDFVSGYFVSSPHDSLLTEEKAHKKRMESSYRDDRIVVEVQIIGESKAHICYCKQTHCCCAQK